MSGGQSSEEESTCALLGGPFESSVQAVLALTAVLTLVYKRSREREPTRRPWTVWFFDCSKQAYASFLQHAVNMAFGVAFASSGGASECAWYLLNFAISVACGVAILSFVMTRYDRCVERRQWTLLKSGEYGQPPSWRPWLAQSLVWGFIASGEKLITAFAVVLPLRTKLDGVAAWLEGPVVAHPRLELIICMLVGPMVLNGVFYWLVDSIIMRRKAVGAEHVSVGDAIVGEGREEPFLEEHVSSSDTFV